MNTTNMRHSARQCVSRAKELLARGDQPSAKYACLELRLAIEYITFDQLQAYLKEVPNDALKKWTPKQVISEMLEVDPHADQSVTIAVGLEHTEGVPPPPEEMKVLGNEQRFTMKWANKSHNALGNFLHAPTMEQIESGQTPSLPSIIQRATGIANECDKILSSSIFNVNFGYFLEFECGDCKHQIQRREGSFTPEQGITCPKCRATYDVESGEGSTRTFHLREAEYTCQPCGAKNWVGIHRIAGNVALKCGRCGTSARLKQEFRLVYEQNDNKQAG